MKSDYRKGIKKDVVEIKFLIHDLRIERFINDIIHFHVTVNTDLEIYNIEQAQILHSEDLQQLKTKAVNLRKAYRDYSNAVKSFSPDQTIINLGNKYIKEIHETCKLILNPHWGRSAKVLAFLPPDSRSHRSRDSYTNSVQWMAGVSRRIQHFLDEQQNKTSDIEVFDIAAELENYTSDVIESYVKEKGDGHTKLLLEKTDSFLIEGSRNRFRRMYFNLIMNAVNAVEGRKVGILNVSTSVEGDHVILRVRDNGTGMTPDKIAQLMEDRETLDGELRSLGFVFVRQTIDQFAGELSIQSEVDEGTTLSVRLPGRSIKQQTTSPDADASQVGANSDAALPQSQAKLPVPTTPSPEPSTERSDEHPIKRSKPSKAPTPVELNASRNNRLGQLIGEDYQNSQALHPGAIFAIALRETDSKVEFFTHRPYDQYFNITHEDLSPMYFQSTLRGRLERNELGQPILTLKEPQSVREYFEFKDVPEQERRSEKHIQMVHDEYIRIARKLIETGMSPDTQTELTGLRKFFPGQTELTNSETFPLQLLAQQALSTE